MSEELNLKLAAKAGNNSDGDRWEDTYEYHLGAVQSPLGFEVFRRKYDLLTTMLKADPSGKRRDLDHTIHRLSIELGY